MIARCPDSDFNTIYEIINDAATAYKDVIPPDCWKAPYMPKDELERQIRDGVEFWKCEDGNEIKGVMGIQDKGDVCLIRHAYVRTTHRNQGIGGRLLKHLTNITTRPVLIGTWAAAIWAIDFYKKHGFHLVSHREKETLLRRYWSIPLRQIETSVVLASPDWPAAD